MKLEYNVLWIEDQFDSVEDDIEFLKELLDDHGFEFKYTAKEEFTAKDVEELAISLQNYNPYDFIIFDYELQKESLVNGLDIAKKLRESIYTDMIFYSANTQKDLRQILFDAHVDGVFVVSKTNFGDHIQKIIEDHIKRISDINNMRGLLLDEMSQCDAILRDVLISKYNYLTPVDKTNQLNKLRKSVKKSYESNLKTKLGYTIEPDGIKDKSEFTKTFNELICDYQLHSSVKCNFMPLINIAN